jgi:hypothetical protein
MAGSMTSSAVSGGEQVDLKKVVAGIHHNVSMADQAPVRIKGVSRSHSHISSHKLPCPHEVRSIFSPAGCCPNVPVSVNTGVLQVMTGLLHQP